MTYGRFDDDPFDSLLKSLVLFALMVVLLLLVIAKL